jgi:hypothetical protein
VLSAWSDEACVILPQSLIDGRLECVFVRGITVFWRPTKRDGGSTQVIVILQFCVLLYYILFRLTNFYYPTVTLDVFTLIKGIKCKLMIEQCGDIVNIF